jgi:hypothetical protein
MSVPDKREYDRVAVGPRAIVVLGDSRSAD